MTLCFLRLFRRLFQDATGYMPRANGQHSFNNLRTVYGGMPVNLTPEYREVELYIRHLVSNDVSTERSRAK